MNAEIIDFARARNHIAQGAVSSRVVKATLASAGVSLSRRELRLISPVALGAALERLEMAA